MKKSDLKTGMVVFYKDGLKRVVLLSFLGEEDILQGDGSWSSLGNFNDDLTNKFHELHDIVSVYSSYSSGGLSCLLWKRKEEIKKMTVNEISEELGYEVEIIGE